MVLTAEVSAEEFAKILNVFKDPDVQAALGEAKTAYFKKLWHEFMTNVIENTKSKPVVVDEISKEETN